MAPAEGPIMTLTSFSRLFLHTFLALFIQLDRLDPNSSHHLPDRFRSSPTMSAASKLTLAATLTGTVGIVTFVHWAQRSEKTAMHAGVLRDEENQRRKKAEQEERRLDFEMQRQLEEQYKKTQTVHDSTAS